MLRLAILQGVPTLLFSLTEQQKGEKQLKTWWEEESTSCSWHRINPIEVLPRNRKNTIDDKICKRNFSYSYCNKIYISARISESMKWISRILGEAIASEYFSSHKKICGILVKYRQEELPRKVFDIFSTGQTLQLPKLFIRFLSRSKFRTLRKSKLQTKRINPMEKKNHLAIYREG